ncbi:MAG: class I tRNA ligase family protein, partial [Victivallaceae bacterium]
IKDKMIAANQKINWMPSHIKDGRFGKWLENARDWNIGRNRYWGTPLPIWRNDEGEILCVGSVAELEKLTGHKVDDLHKHFVDELEIPSPTGKSPLKRVPEVLDCWFESGSMPYAQRHYPFDNKELFESTYPADFIAEGLDQTRGWFYTLVVLGAALFDSEPFKNVIVNGLVLAEDGQKMSKRKKNYPDPMDVVNTYGADAVRLFMLGSQVVRAEDLKFSENGVKEILRSVMIPMWNSLSFFVTYANVDGFTPLDDKAPAAPANPLDRWILSSLAQMVGEVREELDNYNLQKAANRFSKFVDDLTNWYIRLSRRRFWKSQDDRDKLEAYATLYYVLVTFAKTAAPFIPFATEKMYQVLRLPSMAESVHLCDFPAPESVRDLALERQMELAMNVVSLGRFLRKQHNLKVRQPLARVVAVAPDAEAAKLLAEAGWIIRDELNVKSLELSEDEESLVRRSAKANFKVLGSRLGKNMKEAAALIAAFDSAEVGAILKGAPRTIRLSDGSTAEIGEADLLIQREEKDNMAVATGGGVTVALETALTDDLLDEGFAREFVSKVQNMRKLENLEVADRVKVSYRVPEAMRRAMAEYRNYIAEEVLAVELNETELGDGDGIEINDLKCFVRIAKI